MGTKSNIVAYRLKSKTREGIRRELMMLFLKEKPGDDAGFVSSYNYYVDKAKGVNIYLHRPARKNFGIDFIINVEGVRFKHGKRFESKIKHEDVVKILKRAKEDNTTFYNSIIVPEIQKAYRCEAIRKNCLKKTFIDDVGKRYNLCIIIMALKWLFIEQDITYWNCSGRARLYHLLEKEDCI